MGKGFSQKYNINYKETFAPMAKMTSISVLIALASSNQCPPFHMDVKNTFFNEDLHKEVCMWVPPGLTHTNGQVRHFWRALYGLK